jgi:hypothetical protein
VEKLEPFYITDGIVKWWNHYEKQYGVSAKKLRIKLLYDIGIEINMLKRYVPSHIYNCIIHNSQEVNQPKMFING